MRSFTRAILFTVTFPAVLAAQGLDEMMYRSAMTAPTDSGKLGGLNRLIASFPQGKYVGDAYGARFSVLMSLRQDSAAFASIHKYLAAKDSQSLPGALHYVAMELGYRKKYSDSALVFLESAISLYQKIHGRTDPILLHTKAMHLFLLKRFAEAETTQLEAIAMLPSSAEFDARYSNYFVQLGLIQMETSSGTEGLQPFVRASFISTQPSPESSRLDSLFRTRIKDSSEASRVRDSLFEYVAREYIYNNEDTSRAKGFAAASFSRNRVLPDRALLLAREAFREVAGRNLQGRSAISAQLGIVLYNLGKYEEAEKVLTEAAQMSSPYETEVFLTLGSAQERLGKKKEAFTAYLSGVTVTRPPILMKPLQGLLKELYPRASLDSVIAVAQRKLVDFIPDKYTRSKAVENQSNQKVVLAELFTGSECRPCQAADIAYDKLLQRYDRSTVALLEYHLHIPRPDPMTNFDTEERGKYYSVNSTPTSIVEGTISIPGGGQSIAAKSLFTAYADAIDKRLNDPPRASIKLSARIRKGKISLAVSAYVSKYRKSYKLRVVLAEDNIRYQGANGIPDHRFVVRKMIRNAGGLPFSQKGKAAVKDAFLVSTIENQLEHYLDAFEKKLQKPGTTFKEKRFEIDPKQLYIVAFVQDDASRAILQSTIVKVNR